MTNKRIVDGEQFDPVTILLLKSSQMKQAERNYMIWLQHKNGYSFNTLARMYDITPQRAHAIVKAVSKKLRKVPSEKGGGENVEAGE